jgi:hypothetical protein
MKRTEATEISITQLRRTGIIVRIIGETPMIQNRMPAKVMQGLLVGTRKKTKVERLDIKHNPYNEFLAASELMPDGPTAIGLRVVAVKAAMADAALETAGVTKTSAQRLLFMPGDRVPLYGIPKLRMDVVRSADMNRTPDVRSRPCMTQWGAEIEINFITPQLSAQSVLSLLHNAGTIIGVGDGRQGKGKLNCGLFRVVTDENDDEWNFLVSNCGREAQLRALENPEYYDQDSADLMEFWQAETDKRDSQGSTLVAAKSRGNGKGKGEHANA